MSVVGNAGVPELNLVRAGPRGGPPVVLLHSLGFDLTWWGAQFDLLSRDHDVVALDLPGHGFSGYPGTTPTFDGLADAIGTVMAQLDAGPVRLVGISVGGMVAQAVTLRHPDLVHSLMLVATLCTFTDEVRNAVRERAKVTRAEGMARIATLSNERWFPPEFRKRRPDMLDRATQTLARQRPEYHAALWEMVADLDFAARLPAIACPTTVVVGGADPSAPLAAGEKIAELIPGAVLEELPGLGHFPPFEAPGLFNPLLTRFLNA